MKNVRKYAGWIWIVLALVVAYYGLTVLGLPKLATGKSEDLVFGGIVCFILLPIVVGGLLIFGWYAVQGEYDETSATDHFR